MSLEAAMAELVRCSGAQFDPSVVNAMISAVAGGRISLVPRTPSFSAAATR
jgi:HD-GYP domain-containing protein (c-di-GMP phosphodiesterase class II)